MQPNQSLPEPIQITLLVVKVFDELRISYFIGGSLASAVHGKIRATLDADIVVDLRTEHIQDLSNHLDGEFFIDPIAIENALHENRSFNLIHKETMFRIDVFPLASRPFEQNQMQRRVLQSLSDHEHAQVYFTTPEDIVLAKLNWFRMGGETSEQQWQDVLGVIQVQGEMLDKEYLQLWAEQLGLHNLLERAIKDARL